MKANKKFVEEKEAVSAVIGVILMVAITVAIAATVYVYVSGMLGDEQESAPNITFKTYDVGNYLQVVSSAPGSLAWTNINITYDGILGYSDLTLDEVAYSGSTAPAGWGDITGGQKITVGSTECNVTVLWIPTNTLIGEYSFT